MHNEVKQSVNEQWKTTNSGRNEATTICTREGDTPSSISTQLRPERKRSMNHPHNGITAEGGVRARNNIVARTRPNRRRPRNRDINWLCECEMRNADSSLIIFPVVCVHLTLPSLPWIPHEQTTSGRNGWRTSDRNLPVGILPDCPRSDQRPRGAQEACIHRRPRATRQVDGA